MSILFRSEVHHPMIFASLRLRFFALIQRAQAHNFNAKNAKARSFFKKSILFLHVTYLKIFISKQIINQRTLIIIFPLKNLDDKYITFHQHNQYETDELYAFAFKSGKALAFIVFYAYQPYYPLRRNSKHKVTKYTKINTTSSSLCLCVYNIHCL